MTFIQVNDQEGPISINPAQIAYVRKNTDPNTKEKTVIALVNGLNITVLETYEEVDSLIDESIDPSS